MELILTSTELSSVPGAAEKILKEFAGDRIFILSGNLGAGKTTLVQALCRHLGYSGNVSSPTFSIINEYGIENKTIYHMDLYRLEDIDEALEIGIEEYLYSGSYCFIEWAEVIIPILPLPFVVIEINTENEQSRNMTVKKIEG
ncbi:MAG: tRNA (adenosine(37)-N6)-threonylcarbamoyltransferase complex ATPase subunit type 1 TsaE [Saprospiraceae bacterium]|nr:tRNA (adenosine(37)-N6)-threonylcarbamoyltransferase complex ATPase subunit type 1 TsaE [Saprospiraceae bacterium]